ncbi:hypothetical protein BpHYR1_032838 [Brachionus plicatilis]|uniref:Uncharacterized protein n=1 Tax=Brachionus plicatilis TaxID=10195 RepID=A0A3M7QN20_BRAPC|nr:hypothetical protein BpHYR1_032838 [Brachionus plicatilis]
MQASFYEKGKFIINSFKINSVNAEWCNIQSCINCQSLLVIIGAEVKSAKVCKKYPLKIALFRWCAFCIVHYDFAELIFLFNKFDLIILSIKN